MHICLSMAAYFVETWDLITTFPSIRHPEIQVKKGFFFNSRILFLPIKKEIRVVCLHPQASLRGFLWKGAWSISAAEIFYPWKFLPLLLLTSLVDDAHLTPQPPLSMWLFSVIHPGTDTNENPCKWRIFGNFRQFLFLLFDGTFAL